MALFVVVDLERIIVVRLRMIEIDREIIGIITAFIIVIFAAVITVLVTVVIVILKYLVGMVRLGALVMTGGVVFGEFSDISDQSQREINKNPTFWEMLLGMSIAATEL